MNPGRAALGLCASSLLGILLIACCFPVFQDVGETAPGPPAKTVITREAGLPDSNYQVLKFRWEDPNSVPVVERKGDTLIRDREATEVSYSVSYKMDLGRLRWAEENYGVPDDWTEISYESDEDLKAKFLQARARCARHGIDLELRSDAIKISPDPDWIVLNSSSDLAPLARGLQRAAAERGYRDQRGFTGVAASFIQGLDYKIPPDEKVTADGTKISTCGVTMPLETLWKGAGDCDTKCFLMASLLANAENVPAVYLEGEEHMFIGVACPPRPGDSYVTLQGIDFVLIEMTTPWPIGYISRDVESGLQANLYEVHPVNFRP